MPPLAIHAATPLLPPKQLTGIFVAETIRALAGWVTVVVEVDGHPDASVTVTVYVPAVNPEAEDVVPPEGLHEYVYGSVPPVAVAVAVPLEPPKQRTGVDVVPAVAPPVLIMVVDTVLVQPWASVTSRVYVPGASPEAFANVPPEGDHK